MTLEPITDTFRIRSGAVRLRDLGYLLAGNLQLDEDEVQHTAVFEWDPSAGWGGHDLGWVAVSCCVCDHPLEQLVALGEDGEYLVLGQGDTFEGQIPARPTPSGDPSPFTRVASIGGRAYAVGMNSQVFRRDGRDQWTPLYSGLAEDVRLEDIDGFSPDELYAVGWNGALWTYDGESWSELPSPTNLILTSVHCAGDGFAYVTGQGGTLLKGRGASWTHLETPIQADLWDVISFDATIFVSTTQFLHRVTENGLEVVQFDQGGPVSCYHLSRRDGVLWSIGERDVLAFDGDVWSRIT